MAFQIQAKKKRSKTKDLLIEKVEFVNVLNHVRNKGRIYEIIIQTNKNDLTIDSIWFGATPVPCDVYDIQKQEKQNGKLPIGKYTIKVNQDLYKYFSNQIDSTQAFLRFKAPSKLQGLFMIMYLDKTKRKFFPVYQAKEAAQKPLRN